MIDMQAIVDRVLGWAEFSRQYWSFDWPVSPTWTAVLAVLVGVVLALWGARLLRAVYVLGFMTAGGAVGVHFAREFEVDPLIGLVLGAGVAGLFGHVLYRWWIGLTSALCAALIVVAIGGPWLADQAEAFADSMWEQATGQSFFAATSTAPAAEHSDGSIAQTAPASEQPFAALVIEAGEADEQPTPMGFVVELVKLIWSEHHSDARRLAILAGIAAVLGLALGVLLPDFATVFGTSVVGVLALVMGVGTLLSRHLPATWGAMTADTTWFLAGIALVLLVSLAFQARRGRMRDVATSVPAAAG